MPAAFVKTLLSQDEVDGGDGDWPHLCLKQFDIDGDGALNFSEFESLCNTLFVKADGKPYNDIEKDIEFIFTQLDQDKDAKLNESEMKTIFNTWLKQVLKPRSALLIVDVQNDFITGSLKVQDAEDVIPIINRILETFRFDTVGYTRDWHPPNHISFADNVKKHPVDPSSPISAEDAKLLDTVVFSGPPRMEQILWPTHCVQETFGAAFHKNLKLNGHTDMFHIKKGIHCHMDSYSAFCDNAHQTKSDLANELAKRDITTVYICGLAMDFCVGYTAQDAIDIGLTAFVVEDATKPVDLESQKSMREKLDNCRCPFIKSNELSGLLSRTHIPPSVGLHAAKRLSSTITSHDHHHP
ncbi:nicotinamidase-like [Anneissia japonica]|uniref:nicotinamidase-like n=1 Tax=Anneissia japonica TaxID=1529436 RepID=UPI0014254C9C|nr:nicotinamidase-like [Anneissia japonica]